MSSAGARLPFQRSGVFLIDNESHYTVDGGIGPSYIGFMNGSLGRLSAIVLSVVFSLSPAFVWGMAFASTPEPRVTERAFYAMGTSLEMAVAGTSRQQALHASEA